MAVATVGALVAYIIMSTQNILCPVSISVENDTVPFELKIQLEWTSTQQLRLRDASSTSKVNSREYVSKK